MAVDVIAETLIQDLVAKQAEHFQCFWDELDFWYEEFERLEIARDYGGGA